MSSKTLDVVEDVIEHVDETLETLERIPKVNLNGTTKGQQILILGFTALTAAGVGGFFAYKTAQKRLRGYYEEIAETEIAEAKAFYAGSKTGVFADPISARDALIPEDERSLVEQDADIQAAAEEAAMASSEYASGIIPQSEKDRMLTQESLKTPYHQMYDGAVSLEQADAIIEKDPNADVQTVTGRIDFPKTPADADNFDMEKEAPLRSLDTPYVVTHDEYYEQERGFEQQSCTWFAGDSVLVDSADEPIGDIQAMVGIHNMARFGHGSKDNNIVYIRNERFEIDFEVAFSAGTYTEDVLGLHPNG